MEPVEAARWKFEAPGLNEQIENQELLQQERALPESPVGALFRAEPELLYPVDSRAGLPLPDGRCQLDGCGSDIATLVRLYFSVGGAAESRKMRLNRLNAARAFLSWSTELWM